MRRQFVLTTATATTTAALTAAPPALRHDRRHKSLYETVHNATRLKMAHQYDKKKFTSKDVGTGPQHGSGFDPVLSYFTMKNRTGPLRRKQGTNSEDYMDVTESQKWMDTKQAAKVLQIKEEELATLTRDTLEERWVKVYKEKTNAQQSEILIAAEVLLEYLDSTVFLKKNRQYYRDFIENARVSIDVELQAQKQEQRQRMIWVFGFLVLGASTSIVLVAYLRNVITRKDAENIGAKTKDFVLMTFMQPKNVEPAPDYSQRYATTPTAADLDRASGRYELQYLDSHHARVLEEKKAYDEREQAELLKMLNDENERRAQAQLAARRQGAGDSRVKVYRPEDLDPATGRPRPEAPAGRAEGEEAPRFNHFTFRQFADMMASGFGGGSRIQRLTSETSARAEELRRLTERSSGGGSSSGPAQGSSFVCPHLLVQEFERMSAQRGARPMLPASAQAPNAESFLASFATAVNTLSPAAPSGSVRFDDDGFHLDHQSYDVSSYRLPAAGAAVPAGTARRAAAATASPSALATSSGSSGGAVAGDDAAGALRSSGVALAASCATIVAKSMLHPLDTLKCRMQLYEPPRGGGAGAGPWWRGLREAYAGRWGPTALYGGAAIKVLLYVPYQTVYMCSYNYGREVLQVEAARGADDHRGYVARTALAAVVAELGSCVVRVPMETIKMWVQSTASANSMEAARRLRRGGPRACLRLVLPQTVLHDIPYSVTQWVVYETLRPWALRHGPDTDTDTDTAAAGPQTFWGRYSAELLRTFVTGGFSGLLASAMTVPLDSMRTRMVVAAAHEPSVTLPAMARRVYAQEGVRGFFKGGSMRVLWVSANMAVYFPLFELFKRTALEHQRWRDSRPQPQLQPHTTKSTTTTTTTTTSTMWRRMPERQHD